MMAWKVKRGDYLELENCTDSSDEDHGVRDAGPRKDRKKLLMRLSHLQPTDRNSLCWDEFFGRHFLFDHYFIFKMFCAVGNCNTFMY